MAVKLILAVDGAGAIGWSDGRLAYSNLKHDLMRFRALTVGGTVLMGNSTFKSLKRPDGLPNRKNIVLSRNPQPNKNVKFVSSLDLLQKYVGKKQKHIWVAGGASVYDEVLDKNLVDEIHMTLISSFSAADVKIKTNIYEWKRFIISQRNLGILWNCELQSAQWDGDVETTYITLRKISR